MYPSSSNSLNQHNSQTHSSHSLQGHQIPLQLISFIELISRSSAFADTQAKLAAQQPYPSHLLPLIPNTLPQLQYSLTQLQLIHKSTYSLDAQEWIFQGSKLLLPDKQALNIITHLHNCFNVGTQALYKLLIPVTTHSSLKDVIHQVTYNCHLGAKISPQGHLTPSSFLTHQFWGHTPGEDWQVDFTHMPKHKTFRYFFTFVCTFSGWIEAFPMGQETEDSISRILIW